ncbi:MAG TPA: carboxypeptidase-like regulatory domain-containing protein, partial [Sphingobacterium sp.]|nr:carboxypeptidase-like regulatory domain-containing protein [Sphingobacterium sp.]
MKHFYWTLLFIIYSGGVLAQQNYTIKGKVHKESGEPVSHVTIKIEGTSLQAVTDEKGLYIFENVPKGKYNLLISSVEIQPKKLELHVNKSYPDLHIHIDPKGDLALDEVRVQRNTAKRDMEIGGFAVAVIETKEASLRNLTTNELLDRTVGVRVRQNGGVGSQVEYNLNGMSGSTIGMFIDGIEISTYGQSFNLNNIPPAMIERIEVYKGVLPSYLTGDYVGGAINVVLKKDASRNNATVAVSYGSFNTFNSDVSVTLRDKKTGLSFRGSGFYTYTDNSYTTWGRSTTYVNHLQQITRPYRAKRFNDAYESIGGRFEVGFTDTKWANHFFVGYNVSHNYNEIPHGTTMATPYVGRFNRTNANVISLDYAKTDFLTNGLVLNVNAVQSYRGTYLQDTVSIAYNWDGKPREVIQFDERVILKTLQGAQQGTPTMTQIDRRITNIRANLGYMIANGHRLSLNNKYEVTSRDDYDLINPIEDLGAESILRKNIVSMNYEAQTFNDKLRTNLMGKYTTNFTDQKIPSIVRENGVNTIVIRDTSTFKSNFGYGATISYNIVPKLFVIASMENSFIMPNEVQMYGDPAINILPNIDLQAERNVNYNLGFRWGALDFGKHRLSL